MNQLMVGIAIMAFGIIVGGVGVATAGIGIGIPVFPIGIYVAYRGFRIYQHQKQQEESGVTDFIPLEPLEKTKIGKVGLGVLLILVGIGTSAMLIGLPIMAGGGWLIYSAYFKKSEKL